MGNAYSLAERYSELLNKEYDLILATSMTNLATLKSLVPSLSSVRTILYFREINYSYPSRYPEAERDRFHFCMQSLYAAMVSDQLVFNSQYNLNTFISGARNLLKKMRDFAPKSAIGTLEVKAQVILFHSKGIGSVNRPIAQAHAESYGITAGNMTKPQSVFCSHPCIADGWLVI